MKPKRQNKINTMQENSIKLQEWNLHLLTKSVKPIIWSCYKVNKVKYMWTQSITGFLSKWFLKFKYGLKQINKQANKSPSVLIAAVSEIISIDTSRLAHVLRAVHAQGGCRCHWKHEAQLGALLQRIIEGQKVNDGFSVIISKSLFLPLLQLNPADQCAA